MKKTSQRVISHFFAPKKTAENPVIVSSESESKVPPLDETLRSPPLAGKSSVEDITWKPRGLPGGQGSARSLQQEYSHTPSKRRLPASPDTPDEALPVSSCKRLRTTEDAEETAVGKDLPAKAEHQAQMRDSLSVEDSMPSTSNSQHTVDPKRHAQFVKILSGPQEIGETGADRWYGKPPPPAKDAKYTPLEQQVVELKAKYPDVLLMVEVGYKYRFFGADAEVAAKVLGIFAHYDHNFLTGSIPTFRLHVHVRRLVEAGYKVGVVRQTETAAIKAHGSNRSAPFTRNLSALYTRATLEAAEDLGGDGQDDAAGKGRLSSYLMCVVEEGLVTTTPARSRPPRAARASLGGGGGAEEEQQQQEHQGGGGGGEPTLRRHSVGGGGGGGGACEGKSPQKEVAGGGRGEGRDKESYDAVFGVVAVEVATGDVMYGHFKDSLMRSNLEARLLTCAPAELLLGAPLSSATEKLIAEYASSNDIRVEWASREKCHGGGALAQVTAFYEGTKQQGQGAGAPSYAADLGQEQEEEDSTDAKKKQQREQDEKLRHQGLQTVLSMPDLVLQALAIVLQYLKQFGQLADLLRLGATFRPFSAAKEMSLSPNALQQLEVLRNTMDGSEKGSLLWLMDQTQTTFGGRVMHHWVSHPLCDRALIEERLEAVAELAGAMSGTDSAVAAEPGTFPASGRGGGSMGAASRGGGAAAGTSSSSSGAGAHSALLLASVLSTLSKTSDIERGITRIFHRTATPAEFVTVIQALASAARHLGRLAEAETEPAEGGAGKSRGGGGAGGGGSVVRARLLQKLLSAASCAEVVEKAAWLLSAVDVDAAMKGDKLRLFVCTGGRFPKVSSCRAAIVSAEKRLAELLPEIRQTLRSPRLEYMSIMGSEYVIEVPVAQRVPADWIKVNSTKQKNRFHPPQVLRAYDALALAREQLEAACRQAWSAFLADFAHHYVDFRNAVKALAALDCLHALASVARNRGYVRPEFLAEDQPQMLVIRDGRHPVLEATMGDGFVPNDTALEADAEGCQIITGPNMGGKSVYIRQVALIAIMAQIGSFVPASCARLSVLDAVHTRMGSSDSLVRGRSTFLEELGEASAVLGQATARSLVIMDELGRGTSTHDGVAIAYATLHYLLTHTKSLTLFVTHYPGVAELKRQYPRAVGTYFVSYLEQDAPPPALLQQQHDGGGGGGGGERSGHGSQGGREDEVGGGRDMDGADAGCGGEALEQQQQQQEPIVVVLSEAAMAAQQRITFLYKMVPGVASRSFGLHVARLAQIPEAAVMRAAEMAARMQADVGARQRSRSAAYSQQQQQQLLQVETKEGTGGVCAAGGVGNDNGDNGDGAGPSCCCSPTVDMDTDMDMQMQMMQEEVLVEEAPSAEEKTGQEIIGSRADHVMCSKTTVITSSDGDDDASSSLASALLQQRLPEILTSLDNGLQAKDDSVSKEALQLAQQSALELLQGALAQGS